MPHHRGDRRGPRRDERSTPHDPTYVGRRAARPVPAEAPVPTPVVFNHQATPVVLEIEVSPALSEDLTAELPLTPAPAGKRKAVKHAGSRGPLFRGLPSPPLLVGVTVLALAVGGAVASADDQPVVAGGDQVRAFAPVSAMTGSTGSGRVTSVSERNRPVSRDSSRQALAAGQPTPTSSRRPRSRPSSATPRWASSPPPPRTRLPSSPPTSGSSRCGPRSRRPRSARSACGPAPTRVSTSTARPVTRSTRSPGAP